MVWLSWDEMCAPKEEGGLGFRDLKAFNLAFLAKQGWRLQTCTNSIVHRVFKAQYFPTADYLSVELGNQPSYAWRSIMAAQEFVQKGHRWQEGNGESIRIWKDMRLLQTSTFRITSTPPVLNANENVSSLIDTQSGTWRTYMVRQLFSSDDANAILSIPLSPRLPKDRLVWGFTSKGEFSVRSAYKVIMASYPSLNMGSPSDCQKQSLF